MSEDSDDAATMVPEEPRAGLLSRLGGLGLQRVGGLLAAVLIAGFIFAVWSDWLFLKTGNLVVMIRLMGVLGIIGLGLLVVLLVGEIDLSFSALAVLSAIVMGKMWVELGYHIAVGILVAFAVAIGVGLFNAFFVNVVKVPSFIVTLGSNTLVFGFTLLISRNTPILAQKLPPDPEEWQVRGGDYVDAAEYTFFRALASNYALPGRFPLQVVWLAGFAIVFGILLSRGVFGFRMKAIGGNEQAAVLAKLPVRRYKTLAFVICAVMAAVGGLLDFSFISQVQPNQGGVYLFPVFTAVIVGGASLSGGRGTVSGTLLGALLLAVISNGLALNATGAFVQQMWLGTVTIGAVVLDQWTRSRQRSESLGAGLRDLARRLGVLR
ncbi:MAG: ABC transporter permease [Acidimicrobiia bacterium]|nr:ABC transporter permease [Acidimicrobiia bacterium]MYB24261.1 ABC transporter permease [Acidimicrobiia bacterium]